MVNSILIDTWGWLTLNDAGERRHQQVATLYRTLLKQKTLIYTTTFVLDETFTLFFKRLNAYQAQKAMLQLSAAFSTDQFQLIQIDETRFSQAQTLRLKYLDKPQISFTDLTSMAVMQEFGILHVLTEDAHFIQVGLEFQRLPAQS
ncbi:MULTISPECIES: type II toxin-antitoxin system VapC family toxin [Leptolyngbya]|uniref:PIN domain-containing protein n=1 Tax=Leptolyngbya boryana CZ1 TaxID=3060204 RepID=A0AA96WRF0_LEPBY|nr:MULTISPECIES: PIN domain-containing protein [Leptolyngbya]MBD1855471.1 type II toxin-antitoxin system VapC family toxin [Leptolyngbya sp. FACHB-1624]MCY6492248.1 PIN domain-containing protein [Leptolyngbya sp. GGD]WNZ44421.1 PIN domain-containing protein [Leptolyngbya boryana CZ1]